MMIRTLEESGYHADFRCMDVDVTPAIRVNAEYEQELYTLRVVGDHSRYEFCAEDELPSTLAILCDLDMNDDMVRRRVLLAANRIVSAR
jgi:hypothetical protein